MTTPSAPDPESVAQPSPGRALGFALAAMAIVGALALVAGLLLPDDDPDSSVASVAAPGTGAGDATSPPATTVQPPSTSETPAPDLSVPDTSVPGTEAPEDTTPEATGSSELDEVLPDLVAFVEQQRGLPFLTEPQVVALPDAEFVAVFNELIDEDLAEYATEYEQATEVLQAIGMLEPDVTYEDAIRSLGSDGVLGFYEPERNELYVRGSEITPFVRVTIVHELVHAIDDQHFELHRPQYDDRDDEIGFGFSAAVEGNARQIEQAYFDQLSSDEQSDVVREEMGFSYDLDTLSLEFLTLQLAPYVEGQELVGAVDADGGGPAVDALITDPPATSEQVIHPERYLEGEPAVAVAPPPADGEILDEGVFGEIVLQVLLRSVLSNASADAAAEGWGGDWYVAWPAGDETCLRVDIATDTPDDLDELADGLDSWVSRNDGTVEQVGDLVRFTTCG